VISVFFGSGLSTLRSRLQSSRSRCRTWPSKLMRLRWALAHRRQSFTVAGPGIDPGMPAL
jgi:hypothetical protein